jgi:hypothetical protein
MRKALSVGFFYPLEKSLLFLHRIQCLETNPDEPPQCGAGSAPLHKKIWRRSGARTKIYHEDTKTLSFFFAPSCLGGQKIFAFFATIQL